MLTAWETRHKGILPQYDLHLCLRQWMRAAEADQSLPKQRQNERDHSACKSCLIGHGSCKGQIHIRCVVTCRRVCYMYGTAGR